MPRVQHIEASIGEDHAPPIAIFGPQPDNQFVFRDELAHAKAALRRDMTRRFTATLQSYHAVFTA
jgi:hypothetical protein